MDDIYRSQFRLPYTLYERLKAEADRNGRSVNAELVTRLALSFDHPQISLAPDLENILAFLNYDELADALIRKGSAQDEHVTIQVTKGAGKAGHTARALQTLATAPTLADAATLATAPTLKDLPTLDDLPLLSTGSKAKRKPKA